MATKFGSFDDPAVPNNAIYWVQAFGASLAGDYDFQDSVPGPGVTIHYSFKETGTSANGEAATVLTPAEKAQIVDAITKVEQYANVTFVQTDVASADLLFAAAAASTDGAVGRTYPNFSDPANLKPTEVWAYGSAADTGSNSYIYKHELLHALGLNHSTTVFGNDTNPLPADQITGTTLYGDWQPGYLNDYQLFDIAALQYFYGPSPSQRSGNDTYTLNPGIFDPNSPQAGWPLLWDGGGFDTLDYSAFAVPVNISLVPGELSRINGATGHILEAGVFSINYRTVIEAVFGGSGNDTLKGNDADNTIKGGPGDDAIDGGAGIDTAVFSGVRAAYSITHIGNGLQIAGPDGTDSLINVELLQFNDQLVTVGAAPGSIVINDVTIGEGNSGTKVETFTVTRSGGDAAFDINFATAPDSATAANGDYVPTSGTLHFGDGVNTQTISVTINGDIKIEPTESFLVLLGGPTNGAIVADDTGVGTIVNDDIAAKDFSGDGKSDILLRSNAGTVVSWDMNDAHVTSTNVISTSPANWKIAGTGDFNGDGKADILWRSDSGTAVSWDMNDGQVTKTNVISTMPANWSVAGTGDFNGDGKADILLRSDAGTVVSWDMNDGQVTSTNVISTIPANWQIAGTGDFNGDGKSDILLRSDAGTVVTWDMNDGQVTSTNVISTMPANWSIAGTGDFNGDGKSDILLRSAAGTVVSWDMNDGHVTSTNVISTMPANWSIAGTGDFNGDGKADILLRSDSGTVVSWDMNDAQVTSTNVIGSSPTDWHII